MHHGTGRTVVLVLASLLLVGDVAAQKANGSTPAAKQALVIKAKNTMAGDQRHRAAAALGGDSTALLPGDEVNYSLHFTNPTAGPIRGVVFNNPVPAGLRYKAETASADRKDVTIDYSIDGGKTYSVKPLVEVEVDGARVKRPAPPDMYTHIRWTIQGPVPAGASVAAEFKAHLPESAGARAMTQSTEAVRAPSANK